MALAEPVAGAAVAIEGTEVSELAAAEAAVEGPVAAEAAVEEAALAWLAAA